MEKAIYMASLALFMRRLCQKWKISCVAQLLDVALLNTYITLII